METPNEVPARIAWNSVGDDRREWHDLASGRVGEGGTQCIDGPALFGIVHRHALRLLREMVDGCLEVRDLGGVTRTDRRRVGLRRAGTRTVAAALWNASANPGLSRQIGGGEPAVGDARAARDQLGHRSRNIAPRRALTASLGCLERRD